MRSGGNSPAYYDSRSVCTSRTSEARPFFDAPFIILSTTWADSIKELKTFAPEQARNWG
jgi:hypothetical protein